jgi:hypothetical protein
LVFDGWHFLSITLFFVFWFFRKRGGLFFGGVFLVFLGFVVCVWEMGGVVGFWWGD